ncbi:EF-hand domain-containing protein [Streptomyces sp. NPDC097619]|uniref:EF-hand domain-containing protein n=1 Tax=Streptomyces sp. NPDC097619 TaxID=3157228 RepID=UPI003327B8DE
MTVSLISRAYDRTFDMLDADVNGVLEERDFTVLAESIARATGLAEGSGKKTALLREWHRCWALLLENADADRDGRVTREEFHHAMARSYGDRELLERNLRACLEAEFAAIDADDDGVAAVEQMRSFFTAWGLGPEQAAASAERLDTDGDGFVSLAEYLAGWTGFLLAEEAEGEAGTLLDPLA